MGQFSIFFAMSHCRRSRGPLIVNWCCPTCPTCSAEELIDVAPLASLVPLAPLAPFAPLALLASHGFIAKGGQALTHHKQPQNGQSLRLGQHGAKCSKQPPPPPSLAVRWLEEAHKHKPLRHLAGAPKLPHGPVRPLLLSNFQLPSRHDLVAKLARKNLMHPLQAHHARGVSVKRNPFKSKKNPSPKFN